MKKRELVMEVFVLMGEFAHDGSLLLGVYASEEEARTAHGVYTRDGDRFLDYYYVVRQVVGAHVDSESEYRIYIG
jgi:hypothetical protein